MQGNDDFSGYAAARWQSLVRCVVLLGGTTARAEQVTAAALAQCRAAWPRISRADDPDVLVHRALLRTWSRHRAQRTAPSEVRPDEIVTGEPSESQRLREHVQSDLAERPEPDRVALVLRHVAGLSEQQTAHVLGTDVDTVVDRTALPPPGLDRVRDELETSPPPVSEVDAAGTRLRRRRLRLRVGSAAVLVVAALVTSLLVFRNPAPAPLPAAATPRMALALPWWSKGRLHVGTRDLAAPGLTDLADPGVGAVYRTTDADIVLVDAQGGTAVIGHNAAPGIAVDVARGWVFWLTFTRQLVTYDAAQGHLVSRRPTPGSLFAQSYARPLALTDRLAYYENREGGRVWHLATGRVTRLYQGSASMLDRTGDLQVTYVGATSRGIVVTDTGRPVWRSRLKVLRGRFSPDGRSLLVTTAAGRMHLFDARTGTERPTGRSAGTHVQQFEFAHGGEVVYVVPHPGPADTHSTRVDVLQCGGDTASCTRVGTVEGQFTLPQ